MKLTRQGLTFKGKPIRLCPPVDGEAAVVCADLPTGRTSTFTLQLLRNDPDFGPFLRTEVISGPKRGGRQAQVLTTSGVKKLLKHLKDSKPQPRHRESNEEATRWIMEELLPEMEAMETTVGRARGVLVGRPKGVSVGGSSSPTVGSILIKIGPTAFSGEILNPDSDSISVTSGKVSRTWSVSQLFEVMEHHRF